jgi:hypothetical protein
VAVPSSYPSLLTQSVNVRLGSGTYSTKQLKVTVTKSGSGDSNARVEVTGGPSGINGSSGVALYGDTGYGGTVTLTIPVTSSSSTFTVTANDMGVAQGSKTVSVSSGTSNPSVTVTIS